MIVAIHQPQYLPWLPYLAKIAESDVFILLDSVDYQKNGLQNRNKIKTSQGAQWLTVPVHHHLGRKISEIEIDNRTNWRKKHWQSIQQNYARAGAGASYAGELEAVYGESWASLCDLNVRLLTLMLGWGGITTRVIRSSEMASVGVASELVLNLCVEAGATRYVSGTGGRNYLDDGAFRAAGIEVVYREASLPASYPQRHPDHGFLNDLSALDVILNCGPDWRTFLPVREDTR